MRRRLSVAISMLLGTALSLASVAAVVASGPGGPFPK
jgi:hypothetical protein